MEKINFIDVGCSDYLVKPWANNIKEINYILGFDPLSTSKYIKKLNEYGIKNCIYQQAIWDKKGKRKIYKCNKFQNSSFFKPNYSIIKKSGMLNKPQKKKRKRFDILGYIEVECARLDDVIKKSNMNFDFIKIDTQGSELNVLKSLGNYLLTQIIGIYLELYWKEIYEGIPLYDEINNFLKEKGFIDMKINDKSNKNLIGRDFLYIRYDNKKKKQLKIIEKIYGIKI